jgi:CTP-dependent riboflavin kinase
MSPEDHALLALIELGQYVGTMDAFMSESVTKVRARLNCTETEAARVMQSLQDNGAISREITRGGELGASERVPIARWYWRIPRGS